MVAICTLLDTERIRLNTIPDEPERASGKDTPGRYARHLDNIRLLDTPIPARGAVGLWEYNLL